MSISKSLRILIADDDAAMRETIKTTALQAGYAIAGEAADGIAAIELTQQLRPDAVLLDLVMPDPVSGEEDPMAGIHAARKIASTDTVMIILLTDHDTPEFLNHAGRAGIGSYLVKPFRQEELPRAMLLAKARSADLAEMRRMKEEICMQSGITNWKQAEDMLRDSEKALWDSEMKYMTLFQSANDAIFILREDLFIDCNKRTLDMFGCTERDEIIGHSPYEFSPVLQPNGRESQDFALEKISAAFQGNTQRFEWIHTKLDGTPFPAEVSLNTVTIGGIAFLQAIVRDIAGRKQAESALWESREMLSCILNAVPQAIYWKDCKSVYLGCNENYAKASGLAQPKDIIGKTDYDLPWPKDDADAYRAADMRIIRENQSQRHIVEPLKPANGSDLWIDTTKIPLTDTEGIPYGILGVYDDITEHKLAEEQIRRALKEKEVLLQELYHRTKNNMQVIRSMLALQAASTMDETVQTIFRETENRIHAMALVHQRLYQSQDLSHIPLDDYIQELAENLLQSYGLSPARIQLRFELEPVEALIDIAIPCGLIANELISNAFKYAFPNNRSGELLFRLFRPEKGFLEFHVEDNGIGLAPEFDFHGQRTLGLRSIFAIAEHQLQGEVQFSSENGLECRIRFPDDLYFKRV